jgi:hypothetical protein
MADELSNDPAHKLQAALNHDFADTDKPVPVEYLAACRRWFDTMAEREKAVVKAARDAFDKGDEKSAELIVVVLPAAPRFPLS